MVAHPVFDLHERCVYVMIGVGLAGWPMFVRGKNFNVGIFLDTINMINVKLCMMVVFIELYPFIPLSVTLIVFQGHNSVRQFLLKILCAYPFKLKLCTIVDYVK